jgi:hypothetical protein
MTDVCAIHGDPKTCEFDEAGNHTGGDVTTTNNGLGRSHTEVGLGDGRYMTINITHEGIIMDVYAVPFLDRVDPEDLHLGTAGMLFDEWADWLVRRDDA